MTTARKLPPRAAGGICLLLAASLAMAAEPYQEYRKRVESSQTLTALTDTLMGDSVSLYNGATEFTATDIDIPGNNALPVRLDRRFKIEIIPVGSAPGANANLRGAGNWDVDVPYIAMSTVSTAGWASTRCSVGGTPVAQGFQSTDFWQGNSVHVPGGGDRVMLGLEAGVPRPSDGVARKWTTRERDAFTCIPMKSGLSGEGFLMQTASGLKYYFDVAVSRYQGEMTYLVFDDTFRITRKRYYLLASRIEDRFGNAVNYTYDGDGHPTRISSEGEAGGERIITLAYSGGRLATATANGRTWQYEYGTGGDADWLATVVRPDASTWRYAYSGTLSPNAEPWDGGSNASCSLQPPEISASYTLSVTHPSGAVGSFRFANQRHYRSGVHRGECLRRVSADNYYWTLRTPYFFDVMSLQSRSFVGPGLTPMTWGYHYGGTTQALVGSGGLVQYPCTTCATEKTVVVTRPDSTTQRHRYGILYAANEGRLLGTDVREADGAVKRSTSTTYLPDSVAASQVFHERYGIISNGDDPSTAFVRPVIAETTVQDGVTFSMQVPTGCNGAAYCFDIYGNPLRAVRSSTLPGTPSRTESTAYFHQTSAWVLGQVNTVTCTAPATCGGQVMQRTDYDATTALPLRTYAFGKLKQTLTYNADGTVATVSDGRDGVDGAQTSVILSHWKRGTPQSIRHPVTAESPSGAVQSAVVNDDGTIASITDENGFQTRYLYDPMSRLEEIAYPAGDSVAWTKTTLAFAQIHHAEYGIAAGHWRHTVTTGKHRKITYLDAFWRPLVEAVVDDDRVLETRSFTVKRYDLGGQLAFQSYPMGALVDHRSTSLPGSHTTYDALDRPVLVEQDWEGGATRLQTATQYLTGFRVKVTNPRGFATETHYLAYDKPSTDWPVSIRHPESAVTTIDRDDYGKPLSLTRGGPGVTPLTRSYGYDSMQQLCRTAEPETGATLMGYDAAGNLAWSAAGLASSTPCDATGTGNAHAARRVTRSYDARNRLLALAFPDGNGDQSWTYFPDGLVKGIATTNEAGAASVVNAYTYNRRRLMTGEASSQTGVAAKAIGYGYNALGHLSTLTQPGGEVLDLAPNALGQATGVTSAIANYATGASYYPNGGLKQFTYGNGVVHTMTQNARGLPERSLDVFGAARILDDSYDYDANANVAAISDGRVGARGNRTMTYDELDRLETVVSPMFEAIPDQTVRYSYDVLDNLTKVVAPGRTDHYCYVASQLTNIKSGGCSGRTVVGLGYDVQGNLDNKSGQNFDFDFGNRLRVVTGKESYRYDGHGRRVLARSLAGLGDIRSTYGHDGVLRYAEDDRVDKVFNHIYLAGSLIATRETPTGGGTHMIKYLHTDALGSPVAVSNASGTEIASERSEYEPYGKVLKPVPPRSGPGYTGHVLDVETGLNYMQQRYYDPQIGRFLSVDPVAANSSTGSNFSRYWYANDNPYKFTDPDGRFGCATSRIPSNCGPHSDYSVVKERETPVPDDTVPRRNSPEGYSDGRFSLTGDFRTRREGNKLVPKPHKGTDMLGPEGANVKAMASGRVTFVGKKTGFGSTVILAVSSADGVRYENLYGHMSSVGVTMNQVVNQGDVLGVVGEDGLARGAPHVHVEVSVGTWSPGAPRKDPVQWLRDSPQMILDFSKP